jgi:hypothetical protein
MPRTRLLLIVTVLAGLMLPGCRSRYLEVSYRRLINHSYDELKRADLPTPVLWLVTDQKGKPVEGCRFEFKDGSDNVSLSSDSAGWIRVPISEKAFAENSTVKIWLPPGVEDIRSGFFVSTCVPGSGKTLRSINQSDLTTWKTFDVGPDRIYLEPGASAASAQDMIVLLGQIRKALQDMTGVHPGPLAVGFPATNSSIRFDGVDRDGRTVWMIQPEKACDDKPRSATVAQEWMHDILYDNFSFRVETTRFVEEGLCGLVAHMVDSRIRKSASTTTLRWYTDLLLSQLSALPETIDLLELSVKHGYGFKESGCGMTLPDELAGAGYALGLACWLDWTQADEHLLRSFFAKLKANTDPNIDMVQLLYTLTARPGIHFRAVSTRRALAFLESYPNSCD